MKPFLFFSFFIFLVFFACNRTEKKSVANTINKSKPQKTAAIKKPPPVKLIPVFGYRFKITGDFDGDGKMEVLTEHFISGIDHQETNKFYENGDYDTLVTLNSKKKPISFLTCNNKRIKNLDIENSGSSIGLSYIKNEGDLDGDGGDEVSYVVDYADWSNHNYCIVETYKRNKWKVLYSFEIRDWQLPDLPQTYNQYGIAGLQDKIINTEDTVANKQILKNLNAFSGFIKKIRKYKIQIIHINDDFGVDTNVVDIRKYKRPGK